MESKLKQKNSTKNKTKIENLMAGCYEPTLSDCQRIYKEFSPNKGEMASVLSDVFAWLSQEPVSRKYKGGTVYLRAEAEKEMVLCVHWIFEHKDKNIYLDEKSGNEEDITIDSLKSFFSTFIKDYIGQ